MLDVGAWSFFPISGYRKVKTPWLETPDVVSYIIENCQEVCRVIEGDWKSGYFCGWSATQPRSTGDQGQRKTKAAKIPLAVKLLKLPLLGSLYCENS